jgi:hypothetical protein
MTAAVRDSKRDGVGFGNGVCHYLCHLLGQRAVRNQRVSSFIAIGAPLKLSCTTIAHNGSFGSSRARTRSPCLGTERSSQRISSVKTSSKSPSTRKYTRLVTRCIPAPLRYLEPPCGNQPSVCTSTIIAFRFKQERINRRLSGQRWIVCQRNTIQRRRDTVTREAITMYIRPSIISCERILDYCDQ